MNGKQIIINIAVSASTTFLIIMMFMGTTIIPLHVSFESEVAYYHNEEGYVIDETYTFTDFKDQIQQPTVQVSREQLRFESARYKALRGNISVFIDREAKIIWVLSNNPYLSKYEINPSMFTYWWKA